jgi:hypothetical protein
VHLVFTGRHLSFLPLSGLTGTALPGALPEQSLRTVVFRFKLMLPEAFVLRIQRSFCQFFFILLFLKKQQGMTFHDFPRSRFRVNRYLSNSIMNEIDKVLARHCGFADEELHFIINNDIQYLIPKVLEG